MPRSGGPPRRSKYQPIADFLSIQEGDTLRVSFAAIESILGVPLPVSAYVNFSWWRDTRSKHVREWSARGWEVVWWDRRAHVVIFARGGQQ